DADQKDQRSAWPANRALALLDRRPILRQFPPKPEHPSEHEQAADDPKLDQRADEEVVGISGLFDGPRKAIRQVMRAEVGPPDAEPGMMDENPHRPDPVIPPERQALLEERAVLETVADHGGEHQ